MLEPWDRFGVALVADFTNLETQFTDASNIYYTVVGSTDLFRQNAKDPSKESLLQYLYLACFPLHENSEK